MNEGINDTEYSSIPFRDKDDPDSYFVFDSIDRTFYIDNGEWSLLSELKFFSFSPKLFFFFYFLIFQYKLKFIIEKSSTLFHLSGKIY